MATHDYVIANASGAAVRADLNNALAAIVSNNSNATEPATTYAYQWWADTTAGQLKLRNAANDGWVVIGELDGTKLLEDGTAGAPGLAFTSDVNTGLFRVTTDTLAVATNGTEVARFDSNGILYTRKAIGSTFYGDTGTDLRVFTESAYTAGIPPANRNFSIESSCSTSTDYVDHIAFSNPNGLVGEIYTIGNATGYSTSSDYRLKENVTAITDGIARLQQLKPSRFNFISDSDRTYDGFLAHEVQEFVPEAVIGEKDGVDNEGKPFYQGIDQSKLVPLLTAALQEAIVKIEALEIKVAALEAAN